MTRASSLAGQGLANARIWAHAKTEVFAPVAVDPRVRFCLEVKEHGVRQCGPVLLGYRRTRVSAAWLAASIMAAIVLD